MSRETVEAKAERYLISGRLNVRLADLSVSRPSVGGTAATATGSGHENDTWWSPALLEAAAATSPRALNWTPAKAPPTLASSSRAHRASGVPKSRRMFL